MQHTHPTLDTLPLASVEHGPLRDLMETLFEVTLDAVCREQSLVPSSAVVDRIYGEVLPEVFTMIFTRGEHRRLRCEQYVLSPEGQRELRSIMTRRIARALPRRSHSSTASDSLSPTPVIRTCSLPS